MRLRCDLARRNPLTYARLTVSCLVRGSLNRRRSAEIRPRLDAFELAYAIAHDAQQRVLKATVLDQPSKLIVARIGCENGAHERHVVCVSREGKL